MKFMLDSNVVIALALAADIGLRQRMSEHDEGDFVMSAVSYAEVVHGSAAGKPPPALNSRRVICPLPSVS